MMAPACNSATLEVTWEDLGFEVSLSYMGRLFQKRKEGRKGRKGNRVIKSLKIANL